MRESEASGGAGTSLSGLGGAVGLAEAASNSSRRAGGRVQAAGGTRMAGESEPVGARAAARRSARPRSRRSTILPPPVSRAGPTTAGLPPQPARWKTRSHSMSIAAEARSCCQDMPGRFGADDSAQASRES